MTNTRSSTTRCRAVEDNARSALAAAGADPSLIDDLPRPLPVSDLCEIAALAGVRGADLLDV